MEQDFRERERERVSLLFSSLRSLCLGKEIEIEIEIEREGRRLARGSSIYHVRTRGGRG